MGAEYHRTIATNKKAFHLYHILAELECGIVLSGTEVGSLRAGGGSIAEAYGQIRGGELFLVGAHIPRYEQGNVHNHEPVRDRKLLAHARELRQWDKRVREKGMTVVPLEVYFKGSRVKARMGLARGKKLYDKREVSRARTDARDMERAMRRRR